MNPRLVVSSCLAIALLFCGCGAQAQKTAPKEPWTEGFWVWNPQWAAPSTVKPDVLYVQLTGDFRKVPEARDYWATFRHEGRSIPGDDFIARVVADLKRFGRPTRGVQLDIDSPTGSLKAYAGFLQKLRKALPPKQQISITALLDWFRDGTEIDRVIEQVDEFVPQFYDVWEATRSQGIAEPLQPDRYGPRFRRFGKRFRIGLSTFGRGRLPWSQKLYRSITPMDLAADARYKLSTNRNAAGEWILNYAPPKGEEPVQFIVASPESVRASVAVAKQMGASGVIFFRWPLESESLVLQPEEALGKAPGGPEVEARRGDCVAVYCWDVALLRANRFQQRPVEYHIHTSTDVDYTVGEVRVMGPRELVVRVLPFAEKYRMELGRVVTSQPATFTVEAK